MTETQLNTDEAITQGVSLFLQTALTANCVKFGLSGYVDVIAQLGADRPDLYLFAALAEDIAYADDTIVEELKPNAHMFKPRLSLAFGRYRFHFPEKYCMIPANGSNLYTWFFLSEGANSALTASLFLNEIIVS